MRWMTPEQERVYRFILERDEQALPPPTMREISDETGSGTTLAHVRVVALEKKGYIQRNGYRSARNIEIRIRV